VLDPRGLLGLGSGAGGCRPGTLVPVAFLEGVAFRERKARVVLLVRTGSRACRRTGVRILGLNPKPSAHEYERGILFGHATDGNCPFGINRERNAANIARHARLV
jgi:hypothetical protein